MQTFCVVQTLYAVQMRRANALCRADALNTCALDNLFNVELTVDGVLTLNGHA